MAPKKGKKKNNKADFDDDDADVDINLGDIPVAADSSAVPKAPAAKKKKAKKKPTAGDWSDDDADVPAQLQLQEEDDEPRSRERAAKTIPTFAALQARTGPNFR